MRMTAPVYRRVTKKTVMQVFVRTAYIDGGHIRSFVGDYTIIFNVYFQKIALFRW